MGCKWLHVEDCRYCNIHHSPSIEFTGLNAFIVHRIAWGLYSQKIKTLKNFKIKNKECIYLFQHLYFYKIFHSNLNRLQHRLKSWKSDENFITNMKNNLYKSKFQLTLKFSDSSYLLLDWRLSFYFALC